MREAQSKENAGMIKTAIFGAGQAGSVIADWTANGQELICYIDNKKELHGTTFRGKPVMSLSDALVLEPDLIWIASLNKDSCAAIEEQLRGAGFGGRILKAPDFRDVQDQRLAVIRMLAEQIEGYGIKGGIAELGVFKGDTAAELNRLFPDRRLFLFDTFEGFDEADLEKDKGASGNKGGWWPDFSDTSAELVRSRMVKPENVTFIKGWFPDSLEDLSERDDLIFALVSLDADLEGPTLSGLEYFWPRLAAGGTIVLHDYNSRQFPGVKKAADEFCKKNGLVPVPCTDFHGTAMIVNQK